MLAAPALAGIITPDGAMPDDSFLIFEKKAVGCCASVCIGETEVNFTYGNKSGFPPPTDYDDRSSIQFRTWRRIIETFHGHGALAMVQLCQSGNLRRNRTGCTGPGYGPDEMVAEDGTIIHAMDEPIMADTVRSWQRAAVYMKAAGFDGINLHFGHAWLPHQFLSPRTNHRTDAYGGCLENRMRLPLRILKGVREAVGKDFVLEMRISGSERCENGMPLEEVTEFCVKAQEYVDIIHVSAGIYEDIHTGTYPGMYRPNIANLREAAYIKRHVKVPVCIVGGIRRAEDAERLIAEGTVDFVAMGRELNRADPDFANKVAAGCPEDINECIRCDLCMGGERPLIRRKDLEDYSIEKLPELGPLDMSDKPFFAGPFTPAMPADTDFFRFFRESAERNPLPSYCSVNPYYGRKDLCPDGKLPQTESARRILVVGGGVAGMQAAIATADIGFDVVLVEKEDKLGGILRFTDHDKHKYDLRRYKDRLIRRVRDRSWIELRLNTAADEALIRAVNPDFIICAIVSSAYVPDIPGLREHARPLLEAYGGNHSGRSVIVLGGGLSACEAAYTFADGGAKEVTVLARREILPGPDTINTADLRRGLSHCGVRIITGEQAVGLRRGVVIAEGKNGLREYTADDILFAYGMRSRAADELLAAAGTIPMELAGDCVEPSKVYHAAHDGVSAAMRAWRTFNRPGR